MLVGETPNLIYTGLVVVVSVGLSWITMSVFALLLFFASGRLAASRIADIREDVDSLRRSNRRTARAVNGEMRTQNDADLEAEALTLIKETKLGV